MDNNSSGRAVTFLLDGKTYAIDMSNIIEINSRSGETYIPGLPGCITGVINHKGEVIPLIDLRARMGLPPAEVREDGLDKTCLLIIRSGEDIAALRVDEAVTAVGYSDESNFLPLDGEGILLGFIADEEQENSDGERISLFNVRKLLDLNVEVRGEK